MKYSYLPDFEYNLHTKTEMRLHQGIKALFNRLDIGEREDLAISRGEEGEIVPCPSGREMILSCVIVFPKFIEDSFFPAAFIRTAK